MKKILSIAMILVGCIFIVGCGNDKLDATKMSKEEVVGELKLINNNLLNIWNDSLVMVSWYTVEGVDEDGKEIDIDNVITKLKLYYKNFHDYDDFIRSLDDEVYRKVKESWYQVYGELQTIYTAITSKKPEASVAVTYKNNIDLYDEYQDLFASSITHIK